MNYRIGDEVYPEEVAHAILTEELDEIKGAMRDEGAENVDTLTLDQYISDSLCAGTIQRIDDEL